MQTEKSSSKIVYKIWSTIRKAIFILFRSGALIWRRDRVTQNYSAVGCFKMKVMHMLTRKTEFSDAKSTQNWQRFFCNCIFQWHHRPLKFFFQIPLKSKKFTEQNILLAIGSSAFEVFVDYVTINYASYVNEP